MFKVAGKDGVLGWGNLNGLECKVKKDWRLEDRVLVFSDQTMKNKGAQH